MQWTKSSQKTTSLKDGLEYPEGYIHTALTGFLTSHITTAVLLILLFWCLLRRRNEVVRIPNVENHLPTIEIENNVNCYIPQEP